MRIQLDKWGNSLAVRIPAALARELAIAKGDALSIHLEDRRLVITPVPKRVGIGIDDVLAGYAGQDGAAELDWGEPRGEEAW